MRASVCGHSINRFESAVTIRCPQMLIIELKRPLQEKEGDRERVDEKITVKLHDLLYRAAENVLLARTPDGGQLLTYVQLYHRSQSAMFLGDEDIQWATHRNSKKINGIISSHLRFDSIIGND